MWGQASVLETYLMYVVPLDGQIPSPLPECVTTRTEQASQLTPLENQCPLVVRKVHNLQHGFQFGIFDQYIQLIMLELHLQPIKDLYRGSRNLEVGAGLQDVPQIATPKTQATSWERIWIWMNMVTLLVDIGVRTGSLDGSRSRVASGAGL